MRKVIERIDVMNYFKVPLGFGDRKSRAGRAEGRRRSSQLLLTVLFAGAIDYGKYKVWVTSYETRTSKRNFGVLRR